MNLLRNLGLLSLFAFLGCSNSIEVNIPEEAKSIGTYKVTLTEFIRNDKGLVTEEIYTTQLYESNKVVETLEARRIHFEYDANDSLVEETYYTGAEKLTKKVIHKIGTLEKKFKEMGIKINVKMPRGGFVSNDVTLGSVRTK